MGAEHDRTLDGIRALAALSVLAFHVWLYRENRPHGELGSVFDQVLFQANTGLIAFFVLSGFLLYRPFIRAALTGDAAPDARTYAARRAARILPAYYVCCVACIALFTTAGPTSTMPTVESLPLFAVFAQNYTLGTLMGINPVMWTLAIEVCFYAALPLLAILAARLCRRRAGAHAAFLLALAGVTVGWYWLDYAHSWGEIPRKTLVAYIGHFALGMLVALWLEQRRVRGRPRFGAGASAAMLVAGFAIVVLQGVWRGVVPPETLPRALFATLTSAAGFALVIAAAAGGRGPAIAWLRWRPLAWVGVISYGLYLWHLPLLLVLREAGALPEALAPRMLVVLAVSLAAAALSWRFVERPWLGRARRRRAPLPALRPQPAPGAP